MFAVVHRPWWLLAALVAVVGVVEAQERRGPPRNFNLDEAREVRVSGKYRGVERGMILMIDEGNHPYYILVQAPRTKIGVTGTAKPDYLRGGMFVSFTADLDEKNVAAEPLKELRIFTPTETDNPGIFNEDRDEGQGNTYFVRGVVKYLRDGKLSVTAAGKEVQAPVAEDATITIETTNPAVAQPGDDINVSGRLIQDFRSEGNNIRPGVVFGEQIEIKLVEPLSGKKKRAPRAKSPDRKGEAETEQ